MIVNGIDTKDISVVVQGAVDKVNTPKCLKSIRTYLPDAEIILSTWEDSDVDNLDYDIIIVSKDPGSFPMSQYEQNNVKRQIFSTIQGLKRAHGKFALKIRSDIEIIGTGFLRFFNKFNDYDDEWHFLKKRIIVPSMLCRDPRIWESPMCPSDWCSFGLIDDMVSLWSVPFPSAEEETWFSNHPKPAEVYYYYDKLIPRYNPEQFIWIGFCKKYMKECHCNHMFDVNEKSIQETLRTFANNLIILSEEQYGIKLLKPRRRHGDSWHIITYNRFLQIYNDFAKGRKFVFPFDFQKIRLFKFAGFGIKRLFRKAVDNNNLSCFLQKELGYISPLLSLIATPLILYFKIQENMSELWWHVNDGDTPDVSIVIPVHGRLSFFYDTLGCLEKQVFRDFELVVSDDSSKIIERCKIKKRLMQFHEKTGIDIKYVFSKKNLGQSKNTNQGLNHIRGKWCRILHSDDILLPNVLEFEQKLIKENPDVVALFHTIVKFSNLNIPAQLQENKTDEIVYEKHNPEFIIKNALHSHCAVPSSLLFKADMMHDIGKFDPALCRACDWDFWRRIVFYAFEKDKKIIHIQDKSVLSRISKKNNTNKVSTKLSNYMEYQRVANEAERLIWNIFGEEEGRLFHCKAELYRKKRLVNDFTSLPKFFEIFYFVKFWRLLKREWV